MTEAERIIVLEAKVSALTLLLTGLLSLMEAERADGVTEELEAQLTTWQERSVMATSPVGELAQHLALTLLSGIRKRPSPEPGTPIPACLG